MKLKPGRPPRSGSASDRVHAPFIGINRVTRNLSQADLARLVGVSKAALSSWEAQRNRAPRPVLLKIARVLRVRVTDLL
jgi:transcriptional regulator with XRE-family HTH domain